MDAIPTIPPQLTTSLQHLSARTVSGGGFTDRPGGLYRPDATAWAIVALKHSDAGRDLLDPARSRLAREQGGDGRIGISPDHPEAFWPTAVAVLAWQGSQAHREAQARAVQFLLRTTGRHLRKESSSPIGHNPALKGWPWIDETHSWIEPTVLSVMALDVCGYGDHARVAEAVQLLMDRQLPHGGWNYGNTTVFGQELHPAPESTGAALHALAGRVPRKLVQGSLVYLDRQIGKLRTPIALGWSLLGLRSWGMLPAEAPQLLVNCLARQERYGAYETTALCVLLLYVSAPAGLARVGSGE
ncbi:MAG: hypothetical protein ACREIM_07635 [Nitrospiraceae bacterium]